MSYSNEDYIETTLVSGKVMLEQNDNTPLAELKPEQKATWSKQNNNFDVKKVDTEPYSAWKDGKLVFKDENSDLVFKKLERWFDIEIQVDNKEILENFFTATIINETPEQVFELIKMTAPIEYKIQGKQVIISSQK